MTQTSTSAPKVLSRKSASLKVQAVRAGDDPAVGDLIALHQRQAMAANTVCIGHALPASAYDQDPCLTLFAVREGAELLGICGLKILETGDGEIKTLHTRAAARGKGAGQALIAHIIDQGRAHPCAALWLETGTAPFFDAASRLYERLGFIDCGPFGDYEAGPDSRFMVRAL